MAMPALASAFFEAGPGPTSMIVGSAPVTAAETMRARAFRPCCVPASSLPSRVSAAPSTMPEELPAWCTWVMRSTSGYFCIATSSKPPIWATDSKDGLSLPRPSMEVSARTNSSWSRIVTPFWSVTGTRDLSK